MELSELYKLREELVLATTEMVDSEVIRILEDRIEMIDREIDKMEQWANECEMQTYAVHSYDDYPDHYPDELGGARSMEDSW
jgi:hypothetical protein